jgi:hypothetical protein
MADASHECLALTRFLDDDEMPIDELAFEVSNFVDHIKSMFIDEEVFNIHSFTQFAVDSLKRTRVIRMRSGQVKALGGPYEPTPGVRARCMQRMCAWVRLAVQVITTEFPDYEVFQAFAALALAQGKPAAALAHEKKVVQIDTHIAKLAKRCKVDEIKLHAEIADYRPLALHILKTSQGSTFEVVSQS